ncbi:DUF222 domain-containing protein [Dermatophilaceae bacterium Soc4.6]
MDKDLRGVEGGGEVSTSSGAAPAGAVGSQSAVTGRLGPTAPWSQVHGGWRREGLPSGPVPASSEPRTAPPPHGVVPDDAWGQVVAWLESTQGVAGGAPVWRLGDAGLGEVLGRVGRARALLAAAEVALVTEVVERGTASAAGFSVVDWVRQAEGRAAPLPGVREVSAVVSVARAVVERRVGSQAVAAAVASTALPVGKAAQVTRFVEQVRTVADPEGLLEWVAGLVAGASDDLPSSAAPADGAAAHEGADSGEDLVTTGGGRCRGVDERELAAALRQAVRLVRPVRDLEDLERRQRLGRGLTRTDGGGSESGMAHYRMTLDPEGAAVLDAAVSALSAPRRLADGALEPGEMSDPRSAATRRADALLDLVGRAVTAGAGGAAGAESGGPVPPVGEKAQVVVTIDYEALVQGLRGAGVTISGELLSPGVVRRMACDARIIPVVLGSQGQVLDLGRSRRLFSPAQRLVVWRRDRHCTYPGCSVPATWCDVHHPQWWSRGGGTVLSNAALLCRRHHTVVHERDFVASVDDTGVTWHDAPS